MDTSILPCKMLTQEIAGSDIKKRDGECGVRYLLLFVVGAKNSLSLIGSRRHRQSFYSELFHPLPMRTQTDADADGDGEVDSIEI